MIITYDYSLSLRPSLYVFVADFPLHVRSSRKTSRISVEQKYVYKED